jgi:hypothetical protein
MQGSAFSLAQSRAANTITRQNKMAQMPGFVFKK